MALNGTEIHALKGTSPEDRPLDFTRCSTRSGQLQHHPEAIGLR